MKKFLKYSLGAFSWLSVLACQASEKFEVLPDLPDPLAYAMQPAEASTISGVTDTTSMLGTTQSIGSEPNIISVVFSLAIVIVLIYITGIIYAKLNKVGLKTVRRQNADFASSQVSVLSTTQLGNNKTLHVVELDGKRMLIGASSGAIHLIKDLGCYNNGEAPEEFSHIEIPNIKIPKIEIPKIEIPTIGLSKLITKTHKAMKNIEEDVETSESAEETIVGEHSNDDFKTNVSIPDEMQNLSQEGIIDTLFAQQDESLPENPDNKAGDEHTVDPDDFALYKKYLS